MDKPKNAGLLLHDMKLLDITKTLDGYVVSKDIEYESIDKTMMKDVNEIEKAYQSNHRLNNGVVLAHIENMKKKYNKGELQVLMNNIIHEDNVEVLHDIMDISKWIHFKKYHMYSQKVAFDTIQAYHLAQKQALEEDEFRKSEIVRLKKLADAKELEDKAIASANEAKKRRLELDIIPVSPASKKKRRTEELDKVFNRLANESVKKGNKLDYLDEKVKWDRHISDKVMKEKKTETIVTEDTDISYETGTQDTRSCEEFQERDNTFVVSTIKNILGTAIISAGINTISNQFGL